MNTFFTKETIISDIVTKVPQASDILKSYKIDFCCGGQRPLIEAILEKKVNETELLDKLNHLYEKAQHEDVLYHWDTESYTFIIDHIIHKHHAYLYQELPAISQFITKVFRVHGHHQSELSEVYTLFHQLKTELELHAVKEEQHIFPLIKEYENSRDNSSLQHLQENIEELESEHTSAGDILKKLREVTQDYILPEGACMTYQLTYRRLIDLESDLFQHIHLENNILFPRIINEFLA